MEDHAIEREAIAKLKRGDINGLETLVQLYEAQALRAAYLITRDYALAEDIVQTAFLRMYERIQQFDATRPFGPWFLRSVLNSALTALTSKHDLSWEAQMDRVGEKIELPDLAPSVQETLEAAETKGEILAALEQLSPGQRTAVVMYYYLELSCNEISVRLEVPPGTIKRRLHDARQRLRRLLPKRAT